MTQQQITKYNALMKRREMLANFVYVSDLPLFENNGIVLYAAVQLAMKTINEIDIEIENL